MIVSQSITDLAGNTLANAFEATFTIIDTPDLSQQEFFEIEATVADDEIVHSFLAGPGQFVYFDERIICNSAEVRWSCVDEDGTEVVRDEPLEDCGLSDAGRRVLERGGRYDIRVTGVGTYRFAVRNVIETEFDIEIGDTVTEDDPGPGAGRIAVPGEIDTYRFVADPGTEVYFDEIAPECEIDIVWELQDEDGVVLFGNNAPLSGCSTTNQGSVRLERGGLYSLIVEGRLGGVGATFDDIDDGISHYGFQLWLIEPGAFEIAVGDTVAEDTPGPGAGTIETPGNYDVYTFQGNAGMTILFDEIAPPCGQSPIWALFAPDGAALFERVSLEDCPFVTEETLTLESSGTYTIVVRVNFDAEDTYEYSFRLVGQ